MGSRTLVIFMVVLCTAFVALAEDKDCPPAESILPCICHNNSNIQCADQEIPFEQVFEALETFAEQTDQNYHWDFVDIYNITNTVIPANAFGNITINRIYIKRNNALTTIEPAAFSKMGPTLELLSIDENPAMANVEELFEIVNSLSSLTKVDIVGNNYNQIPNNAFKANPNLKEVLFAFQILESIGSQAFYELDHLENLNFAENKLTGTPFIDPNAFQFKTPSDHHLLISMAGWYNLPSAVFDAVDFGGFNGRSVTLDLSYNSGITYFNDGTFRVFMDAHPGSKIYTMDLGACNDCRHAWLLENNLVDSRVRVHPIFGEDEHILCLSNDAGYKNLVDQTFEHCK